MTQVQQIGTGMAIILFPLIFVFAFLVHPRLLKPRPASARRDHPACGQQITRTGAQPRAARAADRHGHSFYGTAKSWLAAWAGLTGGILAVLGAILLAADKGALCLTMSVLDHISDDQFSAMMPGLLAMFNKKGWMIFAVGNAGPAGRVCSPDTWPAASWRVATVAEHSVPDRSVVRVHTGWTGNHQSQRIRPDGNGPDPLRDTADRGRSLECATM